ncbi:hypothetical protein [Azoarcus olearius]|uniref:Uncharacterized protein n=1 Tax=Azoarcus sp. (strain BH72) TaxID=418699 RepID=A1K8V8_AZOSB|nr:hypothetical protein [Azoarcus olearius]CAL95263.1 conserved hypothetical protein [Azoarcus olearius]
MPQLIEYIDAIARKKGRDVLYVRFKPDTNIEEDDDEGDLFPLFKSFDWENFPPRQQIIAWLDAKGIGWQPCGDMPSPNCMVSYLGQIYIDLPYAPDLPLYCELAELLENPDGSMRIPGADFYLVTLTEAMKNAEHDEPGYWERWAEDF